MDSSPPDSSVLGIFQSRIRPFINPQMTVLAGALGAGKSMCLFWEEVLPLPCGSVSTGNPPEESWHIVASAFVSTAGSQVPTLLVCGGPCCWAHHDLLPCHHGHFSHEPLWQWKEWLGMEIDWSSQNEPLYHLFVKIHLLWAHPLWAFQWETHVFRLAVYLERFLHVPLPQTSLWPIIQAHPCQVPDNLAKNLAMICGSL